VSGGDDLGAYEGCDLVLEAVFEELPLKQEIFAGLEEVVGEHCLLATNTSALSVTAMGDGLRHPERIVGMHFFNPVAVLPLVELVRAPATDDVTLATAWDVTTRLGKRGVLVADAPGFVVNRLLTRQTTVLMHALENGNSFEETDEAALRLGLPMPPSALLAMVGPRVANHVLHALHDASPDRFPLSPTLENLANGEMDVVQTGNERRTVDEIHTELLEAMADEARLLLEEGVVGSAAELDACMILGAGWPFHLGGLTKHLDQTGVSERVAGRPLAEVRPVPTGAGPRAA
jgi:3-hydroxyacyl-CoA dehydrogenase